MNDDAENWRRKAVEENRLWHIERAEVERLRGAGSLMLGTDPRDHHAWTRACMAMSAALRGTAALGSKTGPNRAA